MVAFVEARAERPRRFSDGIESEAFYRGGDNERSLRVWAERGAWADARRQVSGGARDFARIVAGMTLGEFMARFGLEAPSTSRPLTAPAPEALHVDTVSALWWALAEERRGALPYLAGRGFPERAALKAESGFACLDGERARMLEDMGLPRWVARHLEHHGPAIAVPIRSSVTNQVSAIHVRPFSGSERRTVGRLSDVDGAPRGYGWAGAALRADVLIVCEGLADTLAAEAMLRDVQGAVAVGAVGAAGRSGLRHWAEWLSSRWRFEPSDKSGQRRVVIVRHLDSPTGDGPGQLAADDAADALLQGGVTCEHFDWPRFVRAAALDHASAPSQLDLAEIVRHVPWSRTESAFLEALHLTAPASSLST